MKITVITGRGGKIVGTARHIERGEPAAGIGGPIAGPGQSIHVIDLPRELEKLENPEELHRKLREHLASQTKSRGAVHFEKETVKFYRPSSGAREFL